MSPKGGKRKGAGKPALYDEPMSRVNVTLDPDTIRFYTKIGKGNLSAGIREYWRKGDKENHLENLLKIISDKKLYEEDAIQLLCVYVQSHGLINGGYSKPIDEILLQAVDEVLSKTQLTKHSVDSDSPYEYSAVWQDPPP